MAINNKDQAKIKVNKFLTTKDHYYIACYPDQGEMYINPFPQLDMTVYSGTYMEMSKSKSGYMWKHISDIQVRYYYNNFGPVSSSKYFDYWFL